MLADDRDLEYLVRQNHLRVVPSACRHAIFAALDALERDINPVGFQEDFAFPCGPLSQNLDFLVGDFDLQHHLAQLLARPVKPLSFSPLVRAMGLHRNVVTSA